eukprot:scaffold38254_cov22-Prasinocladus_malaysianus.AAC.1
MMIGRSYYDDDEWMSGNNASSSASLLMLTGLTGLMDDVRVHSDKAPVLQHNCISVAISTTTAKWQIDNACSLYDLPLHDYSMLHQYGNI